MDALTLERAYVARGRLSLQVRVGAGAPFHTDATLARRLLEARPTLAQHACVNDAGPVFGAVIGHTPLPHVLEHLVIDNQVRIHESQTRASVGLARECAGKGRAEAPQTHAGVNQEPVWPSQVHAPATLTDLTFVGTTEWLDEAAGLARVEVNFLDDLVAFRALHDALALVNEMME